MPQTKIFSAKKHVSSVDNFVGMAVRISREKNMDRCFRHGAALPNDDFQWGSSVEKDRTSLKYKNETWHFCIHDL